MRSNQALKAYYREINTRFFDNELPDNVCVRYAESDEESDCGSANHGVDARHKYLILLNREKNPTWTIRIGTLAHEMVHLATGLRDEHGPAFDRWHKLLTERGLFKKGALRKDFTLF